MIDDAEVKKIAKLAYLLIDQSEEGKLKNEINSILQYVEQLRPVDVSKVPAMSHVHASTNVYREDTVEPSMPIEEALKNAPDRSGRFIRVPLIIDQNSES